MTSSVSKELHQQRHRPDLREHERDQPGQQAVAASLDIRLQLAAQLFDLRPRLSAQRFDLHLVIAAQPLDLQRQIRAQLLDLALQPQLRLAQMLLGRQIGEVRMTFFQSLEGPGDHPRAGAIVGRAGQGFVELDGRDAGILLRSASKTGPIIAGRSANVRASTRHQPHHPRARSTT